MVLVQKEIKAVYLWDTKVRPNIATTTDVTVASVWRTSDTMDDMYHWVEFIALKNWFIKQIRFWTTSAISVIDLKIAKWTTAAASWTTYSIPRNTIEYTLSSPFEIKAGEHYVISGKADRVRYVNNFTGYPITGTAVKYEYGTRWSEVMNYNVYLVESLTIDYTP